MEANSIINQVKAHFDLDIFFARFFLASSSSFNLKEQERLAKRYTKAPKNSTSKPPTQPGLLGLPRKTAIFPIKTPKKNGSSHRLLLENKHTNRVMEINETCESSKCNQAKFGQIS